MSDLEEYAELTVEQIYIQIILFLKIVVIVFGLYGG